MEKSPTTNTELVTESISAATATPTAETAQTTPTTSKNKKIPKIVLIIILVVVLLVAGFCVFKFVTTRNNSENSTQDTPSDDESDSSASESTPEDIAVQKVIAAVKEELATYLGSTKPIVETSVISSPMYKPSNAKSGLYLDRAYGLQIKSSQEIQGLLESDDFEATVIKALNDQGLDTYDDFPNEYYTPQYIDNEAGVICALNSTYFPHNISCGHISWLDSDNLELRNSLSEAYKTKEGEYPDMLLAVASDIEDSNYAPYQTIQAAIPDGYGKFYRINSESNWVFLFGGNGIPRCSDYDSPDARKAFAGESCYDSDITLIELVP